MAYKKARHSITRYKKETTLHTAKVAAALRLIGQGFNDLAEAVSLPDIASTRSSPPEASPSSEEGRTDPPANDEDQPASEAGGDAFADPAPEEISVQEAAKPLADKAAARGSVRGSSRKKPVVDNPESPAEDPAGEDETEVDLASLQQMAKDLIASGKRPKFAKILADEGLKNLSTAPADAYPKLAQLLRAAAKED